MRFTLLAITAFAASVSASALYGRQTPPDCVTVCGTKVPFGDCTDNACLCKNAEFVAATTKCVEETCPADQVEAAKAASRELCEQAGVTLSAEPPSPSASDPPSADPSGAAPSDPAVSDTPPAPSGSKPASGSGGPSKTPSPSNSGSGSPPPSPSQSGTGNGALTHGASAAAGILAVAAAALIL